MELRSSITMNQRLENANGTLSPRPENLCPISPNCVTSATKNIKQSTKIPVIYSNILGEKNFYFSKLTSTYNEFK
jgi:hypothetical protein